MCDILFLVFDIWHLLLINDVWFVIFDLRWEDDIWNMFFEVWFRIYDDDGGDDDDGDLGWWWHDDMRRNL